MFFFFFFFLYRISLLEELRIANQRNRLRFNSSLDGVMALYGVVRRVRQRQEVNSHLGFCCATGGDFSDQRSIAADEAAVCSFVQNSHVFSVSAAKDPSDTLLQISQCVAMEEGCNALISSQPRFRNSSRMALRQEGYSDWQWPFLLQK